MFKKLVEKITHRQEIGEELERLREAISRQSKKIDAQGKTVEMLLKSVNMISEQTTKIESDAVCSINRLDVLENDRDKLFKRLEEIYKYSSLSDRICVLEQDRDELFSRIDGIISRTVSLEDRFSELNECADETNNADRVEVLEQDRNEIFRRIDDLIMSISSINERENNLNSDIEKIYNRLIAGGRITVLEQDRDELFKRIDSITKTINICGFSNLKSKLDPRVIRLEILWYYRDVSRRNKLNDEQKKILDMLENDYDYGRNEGRKFPEDPFYEKKETIKTVNCCSDGDDMWYAEIYGKKLYLGENKQDAEDYLNETLYWLEGDTPHRYIDTERDGIDVPEGSILLDIGAAEGYFGIRYLDRCKKVYFFEYDEKWLKYLRKTCEPYSDKVEIVEGYVGDGADDIRLDEFFKDKEKPTFIKMDVEGAEGSILRGATDLLHGKDPLTLLICTYHRVEDWDRYYDMLHKDFNIYSSKGYHWDICDPYPPFFRRGIMKAVKKIAEK